MAVQIPVGDRGKQEAGTFKQIGRGQGTGQQRIGVRQQPGHHHEENGHHHSRLDQTEEAAHEPVKPAEKREAHDLFEHIANGQDSQKNREKQQGVGHQKRDLRRRDKERKVRAYLFVIPSGKKVAENERRQGGQLANEADPDAANKKDEHDGDDAEINCSHG